MLEFLKDVMISSSNKKQAIQTLEASMQSIKDRQFVEMFWEAKFQTNETSIAVFSKPEPDEFYQ